MSKRTEQDIFSEAQNLADSYVVGYVVDHLAPYFGEDVRTVHDLPQKGQERALLVRDMLELEGFVGKRRITHIMNYVLRHGGVNADAFADRRPVEEMLDAQAA